MKANIFYSSNISLKTSLIVLSAALVMVMMMAVPVAGQSMERATAPIEEKIVEIQEMLLNKNQEVRKLENKLQDTYGTSRETCKKTSKMREELEAAQEEVALIERALDKWETILDNTQAKIAHQGSGMEMTREKADLALTALPVPAPSWESEPALGIVAR